MEKKERRKEMDKKKE